MSTADKDDSSTDNNNDSEYDNDLVNVNDIDEEEEWVDLEAAVEQLWEPNSDDIAQVGLLRDASGIVKFVSWASAELREVQEGETYTFSAVVTDEYDGDYSVNLTSATEIEDLDEDLSSDGDDGEDGEADTSDDNGNDNELVDCDDVDSDEEWIDVEAEVDQLWEPNSESIAQVGLLSDDSGRLKFTAWEKSDLQEVEEGERYHFGNVVTNEYEGNHSVNLNANTEIEHLDGDDE